MNDKNFTVWLVWSTNVWKSTLFNRLIWQFRAIVTDIPGTTTDILRHKATIENIGQVQFADSPGLTDFSDERHFIKKIIDESDLIIFVIDDSTGISAKEQQIFSYIMDSNKKSKTLLVINKLDVKWKEKDYDMAICDYYNFGFENIIWVSAKKENGVGNVKEFVKSYIEKFKLNQEKSNSDSSDKSDSKIVFDEEKKSDSIWIAILGKPNTWKSTLLNTFVWTYISKVEDKSWTTRDYVVGDFQYLWKNFTLYDTAWIRNKSKMLTIEKIAYQKTIDMLKFLRPIVIFMIDSRLGMTHKDMTLLREIYNIWLPIIFWLNKIDLLTAKQLKLAELTTKSFLEFAKYIPIIPMVATTGKWQTDIMKMVIKLRKENLKRIETSELNKMLNSESIERPARFAKNRVCKIFYATQIQVDAPTFMIFINHKDRANFAFKKRIENSIRKNFGFIWIPIVIKFKERGDKEDREEKKENNENE